MDEKKLKIKKQVHLGEIERTIKGKFGGSISDIKIIDDEIVIDLDARVVDAFARFLKNELSFDYLRCLSGVDYIKDLEVVYHLFSIKHNSKITVKVRLPKDKPTISSVTPVWRGADWHERETAELLGITFDGHPDLRRLLLTDDFKGHPLRKDFKIEYKKG